MDEGISPPTPGWIVQLNGHEVDLSSWEQSLKPPFDPWCERIPRGGSVVWALRSHSFDDVQSAVEVRECAIPLIERLNGALRVGMGAEPVTLRGVGRIDDQGGFQLEVFLAASIQVRGMVGVAAEVRDARGNLIQPPPPEPSTAQRWIEAAGQNDDIADMLVFAGRADNWFDIFKTVELAEKLAGNRKKLRVVLGGSVSECERMWRTSNFYRHARAKNRPPVLTTLTEARPLLSFIVRTVMAMRIGSTST